MISQFNKWLYLDLQCVEYRDALNMQRALVNAMREGLLSSNLIILLEHPSVFTLGRSGGRQYLMVDDDFLKDRGIPLIQVERGGFITYHGPGQLVGYPILDFKKERWLVDDFIWAIEEVMIQAVAKLDIQAERNTLNRGIWVGPKKLGSIGIAIRHGVSYHGFSLNVNVNLEPISWIQPCGLSGVTMTSMQEESIRMIPMGDVRGAIKDAIQKVFNVELFEVSRKEINRLVNMGMEKLDIAVGCE